MFFTILFTFFFVFIVSVVIYVEYERKKIGKTLQHIPSVQECPIIGTKVIFSFFEMTEYKRYIKELVYEPVLKMFVGPKCVLILSDPDALQEVLNNPAFSDRPYLMRFFPYVRGIVSSEYHIWKPARKVLNNLFSHRSVTAEIPIMNKHFLRYKDLIGAHVGCDAFDFNQISLKVSMNQVMESIFKCDSLEDKIDIDLVEQVLFEVLERVRKPQYHLDFIFQHSPLKKRLNKLCGTIEDIVRPVILEKMNKQSDEFPPGFFDLMNKPLKDNQHFEYVDFLDNFLDLFVAAYETTSLTTSYLVLMCAMYPDVDAKIIAELRANYAYGDSIDYELIKRLPYLDLVLKEVLRLFPAVPTNVREALHDVEIKGIGIVPKTMLVAPVYYQLHRWAHLWGPDVEQFNPDRFLPENIAKRHPHCYLPFSTGTRNCIGIHYANINVKLAAVHILSQYRFTTDLTMDQLQFKYLISLRLANKHMVQAHLRDF